MTPESEKKIGLVALELADALMRFARERRDDDRKAIAALHTELCAAVREARKKPEETI
jgi:hypothetical protein